MASLDKARPQSSAYASLLQVFQMSLCICLQPVIIL